MESPTSATLRSIIENTRVPKTPSSYFKVLCSNACKRIFNSSREKKDMLSTTQKSRQFLALNVKQLEDTLANIFPESTHTFFMMPNYAPTRVIPGSL
jgi:hypothetical protein